MPGGNSFSQKLSKKNEKDNKEGHYSVFQLASARSLKSTQVPFPPESEIKPGQALVEFAAATVCGSDMPKWSGTEWSDYPAHPGFSLHECVGWVVHSNSPKLKTGDHVLAMPINELGLQEFFITNDTQAIVLDDRLSSETAALIQPLATVLYAIERLGNVKDKNALVIGLGSLGHLAAWYLKRHGAHVSTIDPVPSVLQDDWGLNHHHNSKSADVTESDLGDAPDIIVEVVGHQEETINDALRLVRRRGTVLLMGVPRPGANIDLETAFRRNVAIISSVTPPWLEYMTKAQKLVVANEKKLRKLITHTFPFDEAAAAYETYADRKNGRLKVAIVREAL